MHRQANTIIDAKDKLLLLGMIDHRVHFREPGLIQKGDMATESRAAVACVADFIRILCGWAHVYRSRCRKNQSQCGAEF